MFTVLNLILFILRNSPNFNKEVYVDFVAAQIKTLSFLAFIIRSYQVSGIAKYLIGRALMLNLVKYV